MPLSVADRAVAVLVAERGQELSEHLLGGHLASLHLGMLRRVVAGGQVSAVHLAGTVGVELGEGAVDDLLAHFVGLATDAAEELVEVNEAVAVGVESLEANLGLALADGATKVLKAPVELLLVELAVALLVHDLEGAAETTDGLAAAGLQVAADLIED